MKMAPEELNRHSEILDHSSKRGEIARSAVALAASEDDDAVAVLGRHLQTAEFLNRLDDTTQPGADIDNLAYVMTSLTLHPTAATGRVCEMLFAAPDFTSLAVRVNFLLAALAAVVPTTEGGAEVFRASSRQGYAEVIGPLLLQNESPLALEVFEEMIAGDWLDAAVKVEILHRSVLPKRTDVPVLLLCERLLERNLEVPVRNGLIETLYDYRSREWFGPERQPPKPPPWESASADALQHLIALAKRLEGQGMDEPLQAAVRATRATLEAILRTRLQ